MDRFGGAMRPACLLLLIFCLPLAAMAEEDPTAGYRAALDGDDADAKRATVLALVKSPLPDGIVLPLLVQAVGDRQVHIDAIMALRERTGLVPSPFLGQSSYPNYPPSDYAESWQYWLRDWESDHLRRAEIDEALREAREADAAATKALEDATRPEADRDQLASATSTPSKSQP
jgi:hypothetical protein